MEELLKKAELLGKKTALVDVINEIQKETFTNDVARVLSIIYNLYDKYGQDIKQETGGDISVGGKTS